MKLTTKQLNEIKYLNKDSKARYYKDREDYMYQFIQPYIEDMIPQKYHTITHKIPDEHSYIDYQTAIYEVIDSSAKKKVVILQEVKVRDTHYDELLLEEKKLNNVYKTRDKFLTMYPNVRLFYICVTPVNVFIFDLDNISIEIKNDRAFDKATCDSDRGKEYKKVTYLNIKDALRTIDFKADFNEYHESFFGRLKKTKLKKCIFG